MEQVKARRWGAGGIAGALALLALAGCGHADRRTTGSAPAKAPATDGGFRPGTVAFGVLAPLSGAEQRRGTDLLDGAKLAAADLNVRGGVLGQKVAVVAYDDRCAAAAGRSGARSFTAGEVAGALGGICTPAARAAARELGTRKPFLVTSANAPDIVSARRTPNAYLLNGTPYQSALATVHWLAYRTAQRLAVVTEDDRASRHLGGQVLGLAAPAPKALTQQAVPTGTTEWATIVKTALTGDPDTVYWAGSAATGGAFAAALRAAGFTGSFIASAASESPEFLRAAGPAAEGAFVIAPASPQNLPEAAHWAARFQQRFGRAPGVDALRAYDGVRALAQAVTQSGKVDAARNSRELAGLDETYTTFLDDSGGLPFASDHTVRYDNNVALTVKGGKLILADKLRSDG